MPVIKFEGKLEFIPSRGEKISHEDYCRWRLKFFNERSNGRFGQAFINEFYPEMWESVSDIFYSELPLTQIEYMIYNRFVKFDDKQ